MFFSLYFFQYFLSHKFVRYDSVQFDQFVMSSTTCISCFPTETKDAFGEKMLSWVLCSEAFATDSAIFISWYFIQNTNVNIHYYVDCILSETNFVLRLSCAFTVSRLLCNMRHALWCIDLETHWWCCRNSCMCQGIWWHIDLSVTSSGAHFTEI